MTTRFTNLIGAFLLAATLCAANTAWAQKKYTITRAPSSTSQYLQQHAIDVDDSPGHQVRVYEIRNSYSEKDFAFGGVLVKESISRGMSDYINFSGPFITYTVYTLEDGNKIFSRNTGTSQSMTKEDGSKVVKFSFVENFTGGTGKFKGIRGQIMGSGERAPVAKTLTVQSSGEYWLEE
ncbi:MAG TPA: hypothetical protein VMH26_01450 [Burkholderiales bacterium]|nr:hypothetical protein [Burkholderiales bacterium]